MGITFIPSQVISYECQICGDCCANDYEKPISPQEITRLQQFYPTNSFFVEKKDKSFRLAIKESHCWFLERDGTCRIHQEQGVQDKPINCRRFPFSFQRLEKTVYIGYSFACLNITPFPERPDNKPWNELYNDFKKQERVLPSTINIFSGLSIPTELYLQMENYFLIFLKTEYFAIDFPTRLIGIYIFFSMLQQFIQLDENKERSFDENCALFLSGLGQTNFQTIIDTSLKICDAEKNKYRRFWWFICDYLHSLARYREKNKIHRLFMLNRQLFRSALQFKKFQIFPLQPDWNHPLLKAFYIHLWERKEFIHPNVDMYSLVKYFIILCGVIAVRYKFLMTSKDDLSPDDAIRESLKFVELHFGYHVADKHKIIYQSRLKKYIKYLDKAPLSVSSIFRL